MIVSIITVVLNCKDFIGDCLDSVYSQTYLDIEHIIIDGGSSDGTLQIIREHSLSTTIIISESDRGYYDALNKGIKMSQGNVIGVLNADDEFSDIYVVEKIVRTFRDELCAAVYGNINYVDRFAKDIVYRKWRDKNYDVKDFRKGWMPAHTSLFLSSDLFSCFGYYSLSFGTCADYDLIIRFLYLNNVKTVFKNELFISMRTGGMSNGSLSKIVNGFRQDYRILQLHQFRFCLVVVILKRFRKLRQFLVYD
ncbi:MAG: glycosyltransferase family 2 protein [Flavobacterium sp.]